MYLIDTSVGSIPRVPPVIPKSVHDSLILSGYTAITEWILLELMTSLTKSEHPDTLL